MQRGGFDAVIGNPPYVGAGKIDYLSPMQKQMGFPDIYALVMLRSLSLAASSGRCGMIVPLSLMFSEDFANLRQALDEHGASWFSSYDNIPAAVFSGVSQRCTIWLSGNGQSGAHSTPMYRWRSAARPNLVGSLSYTSVASMAKGTRGIPKVGNLEALSVEMLSPNQAARSNGRYLQRGERVVLGFDSRRQPAISFQHFARTHRASMRPA